MEPHDVHVVHEVLFVLSLEVHVDLDAANLQISSEILEKDVNEYETGNLSINVKVESFVWRRKDHTS